MLEVREGQQGMTVFAVITKTPNHDEGAFGNLAMPGALFVQTVPNEPESIKPLMELEGGMGISLFLSLRAPVFVAGEILILDEEDSREVDGRGRKPSKWDVSVEHFENLEDALAKSREVVAAGPNGL